MQMALYTIKMDDTDEKGEIEESFYSPYILFPLKC